MNFLKRQLRFLKTKKKIFLAFFCLVIITGLFIFFAPQSLAQVEVTEEGNLKGSGVTDIGGWFVAIIGNFLLGIIGLLTSLLLFLIDWVASLFQYNNFLHSQAVLIGWPLVRDLCNMFFVVIMLIVAFSTILKVSRYHYKDILWKLLIMAILINFSKTILGFIIDFGQVIMLAFVNGFKELLRCCSLMKLLVCQKEKN